MTDDGDMFSHPELLTEIAIRAFARAKKQALEENDRLGIPSYGSKDGKIVVRYPPQAPDPWLERMADEPRMPENAAPCLSMHMGRLRGDHQATGARPLDAY